MPPPPRSCCDIICRLTCCWCCSCGDSALLWPLLLSVFSFLGSVHGKEAEEEGEYSIKSSARFSRAPRDGKMLVIWVYWKRQGRWMELRSLEIIKTEGSAPGGKVFAFCYFYCKFIHKFPSIDPWRVVDAQRRRRFKGIIRFALSNIWLSPRGRLLMRSTYSANFSTSLVSSLRFSQWRQSRACP